MLYLQAHVAVYTCDYDCLSSPDYLSVDCAAVE